MTAQSPTYNLNYHFDSDLRDVPDAPEEMRAHVKYLEEQLAAPDLRVEEQLRLLGTIGVYARMLGDTDKALQHLETAVSLAEWANNPSSYLANRLRLGHVYQWLRRFAEADAIFMISIAQTRADRDLYVYLDFAYQHYGKSLFDQGRFAEAESAFSHALILREAKGDDALLDSTRYALEVTRSWLGK